ncbi:NAD(P)/FAD-dependent oxidoreductase [Streptomyces sp. 4503]|uniref:NAD(P)/FAD-dependent oxidoreductase n=1 Tax=Streptomyces niphimycinicus TaxID=2842201 RepID=A0ABS6CTH0_9ACTN|nr:FAD/NAD(P)-binding protein [Streptomyces niphimycinicus]MBU3870089.1 NAD(P)/FAD-dependent oxidoreductase [Streptomyces niphimycinicus]
MKPTALEVDYLIVGAGAMGMAFADTLIAETDATVAIVDRYDQPGGHWTVAYPFVRLHQPSAFYGVNSCELGSGAVDQDGWNAGLHELASAGEILTYLDQVMHKTLLPTGRLSYFPKSFYDGPDPQRPDVQRFHSIVSGATFEVTVKRRTVDATYMNVTVPAMAPPKYEVAPGVRLITPNELPALQSQPSHYTVVGAGKTGIDACLWLLGRGTDPSDITWIMPRDSWLLDRAHTQPGNSYLETEAARREAVAGADTVQELFARLEDSGLLLRLSPGIEPTAYRCATVARAELEQLRRIGDIVRHGRVKRIDENAIELDQATITAQAGTLYIDCTADGLERRPTVPVFDQARITLQAVIPCQQVFSAALIAHVEASRADDDTKNTLCAPSQHPDSALDWIQFFGDIQERIVRWTADPGLAEWLRTCRLMGRRIPELSPEQRTALLPIFQDQKRKLEELLRQANAVAAVN